MAGNPDKISEAHGLIAAALRKAEALYRGDNCAGPSCTNTLAYSGTGRPALYCCRRCRDRAAYAAKRQQQASEGAESLEL
jgi:hypothetical protein